MNLKTGSITEFVIDEPRKKELAQILGSQVHSGLKTKTSLKEKLDAISVATEEKRKIQDYGIQLKQCQFLIPQFFPMILFTCQLNGQERQNQVVSI